MYLLFAKLAAFSDDEIAVCRAAQDDMRPRVIMLSARELEPYRMYEFAAKEVLIRDPYVSSLADMAVVTAQIYFNPVPKEQGPG
ncbi:MAG TPA: hypothetical protein ENN80_14875 [Candidatus Hydrogenedentes bacterium]|nr:hypothetical protein [Candidatus Hydrogenedentota bacterium]